MFHANESCDGKGTLTVQDGKMTIHVSLASKSIVNLFPGLAEDAQKEGAELLQPTEDAVTYSDGLTETVYGFDIPVPYLDDEFDLALIGKKGVWYDHKVSVSNPEPKQTLVLGTSTPAHGLNVRILLCTAWQIHRLWHPGGRHRQNHPGQPHTADRDRWQGHCHRGSQQQQI